MGQQVRFVEIGAANRSDYFRSGYSAAGITCRYSVAALRRHLAQQGNLIGLDDLLNTAHALTKGLPVVTDNVREFVRVSRLRVENWLR